MRGIGVKWTSCIIGIEQETENPGGPMDPILSRTTSKMNREKKLTLEK